MSTVEEQFAAAINDMDTKVKAFRVTVDVAERSLGSVYADNPDNGAELRSERSRVAEARATYAGASAVLQIALGYRTGILVVPDKQ